LSNDSAWQIGKLGNHTGSLSHALARFNSVEIPQVPEFRVAYTITTDALDALYKKLKPKGVTMSALLAKACGVALSQHPIIYAGTYPSRCFVIFATSLPCLSSVANLECLQ
jgi:pyruvate dehydrogenase E2 component (dihydrolipoamide acetyltransferase)